MFKFSEFLFKKVDHRLSPVTSRSEKRERQTFLRQSLMWGGMYWWWRHWPTVQYRAAQSVVSSPPVVSQLNSARRSGGGERPDWGWTPGQCQVTGESWRPTGRPCHSPRVIAQWSGQYLDINWVKGQSVLAGLCPISTRLQVTPQLVLIRDHQHCQHPTPETHCGTEERRAELYFVRTFILLISSDSLALSQSKWREDKSCYQQLEGPL